MMTRKLSFPLAVLLGAVAFCLASIGRAAPFPEARIFIEFNSSDNDLGFHVFLDAEDWKTVTIVNPRGVRVFEVSGKGAFAELGLTELFFEGAEPPLDEFPLDQLLARFPEGQYTFTGTTVDGHRLQSKATLTHAVPAGPDVSAELSATGDVAIRWEPVAGPPEDFPDRDIRIVGFQVIVGSFQVTLPADSRSVKLPEAFVESLDSGGHGFEVLAIEAGGNQTITQGSFTIP